MIYQWSLGSTSDPEISSLVVQKAGQENCDWVRLVIPAEDHFCSHTELREASTLTYSILIMV